MRDDSIRSYPRPHPATASRIINDRAVVVTPADGRMHSLNEVGTWLWRRADGTRSIESLIRELVQAFEVDEETAREDVSVFVAELVAKGALEVRDEPV